MTGSKQHGMQAVICRRAVAGGMGQGFGARIADPVNRDELGWRKRDEHKAGLKITRRPFFRGLSCTENKSATLNAFPYLERLADEGGGWRDFCERMGDLSADRAASILTLNDFVNKRFE